MKPNKMTLEAATDELGGLALNQAPDAPQDRPRLDRAVAQLGVGKIVPYPAASVAGRPRAQSLPVVATFPGAHGDFAAGCRKIPCCYLTPLIASSI